MCEILIGCGALREAKNDLGMTPQVVAELNQHKTLFRRIDKDLAEEATKEVAVLREAILGRSGALTPRSMLQLTEIGRQGDRDR